MKFWSYSSTNKTHLAYIHIFHRHVYCPCINNQTENIEQKRHKCRNPVKIQKNVKKPTPQKLRLKKKEKPMKFPNNT